MEIAIGISLEKDSTRGEQRGISHDGEWPGDVRDGKYRSRREGGFEGIKCALLEVSPGPWLVLSCEEVEGGDNVGEVGDKLSIKVCKSEERSDAFDRSGGFPFLNGREFD